MGAFVPRHMPIDMGLFAMPGVIPFCSDEIHRFSGGWSPLALQHCVHEGCSRAQTRSQFFCHTEGQRWLAFRASVNIKRTDERCQFPAKLNGLQYWSLARCGCLATACSRQKRVTLGADICRRPHFSRLPHSQKNIITTFKFDKIITLSD